MKKSRKNIFEELVAIREKIHDKRKKGVNEINKNLDEVKIDLEKHGNRQEYKDWLKEVLIGSNVRNEDREKLAEKFSPIELADIVRSKNCDELESIGLTETAAQNVIEHRKLKNNIQNLETQEIKDKPIIKLKDGRIWRPLSNMSEGQKCTALLSIALLERKNTLIIDQPEDMLDNKFIHSSVVRLIRNIKHNRQLIMATHNANIPILGDAEQIIVMESFEGKGHMPYRGSIDDEMVKQEAQDILEGGKQAFNMRRQKYGY